MSHLCCKLCGIGLQMNAKKSTSDTWRAKLVLVGNRRLCYLSGIAVSLKFPFLQNHPSNRPNQAFQQWSIKSVDPENLKLDLCPSKFGLGIFEFAFRKTAKRGLGGRPSPRNCVLLVGCQRSANFWINLIDLCAPTPRQVCAL